MLKSVPGTNQCLARGAQAFLLKESNEHCVK